MGYYARTQPHAGAPFAAMSLYNEVNGGRDVGTSVFQLYDALKQKGITEQAVWTHGLNDVSSRPSSAEAANALTHRTSGGTVLFLGDRQGVAAQTAIETALAAGHPVAIGMPVYDAFFRLSAGNAVMTASRATGTNEGGHEVAAYGYDATGIKIANSWGKGWGNAGWATLSWDFVDRYVFEASTPGTLHDELPGRRARLDATGDRRRRGDQGARRHGWRGGRHRERVRRHGRGRRCRAVDRHGQRHASRADLDVRHRSSGHGPAGGAGRYGVDRAARQGAASAPVTVTYAASISGLSVTHGRRPAAP